MSYKELNSLARQVAHTYSFNKRSATPKLLYITDLPPEGVTGSVLKKQSGYSDEWQFFEVCGFADLFNDHGIAREDMVYLTADSEETVTALDDKKTYVIGGIVDRNRLTNATLNKARELGIKTAKLPIGEIMKMQATKVLTVNHVAEILTRVGDNGGDWERAIVETLPQRKKGVVKGEEEDGERSEQEEFA